MDKISSNALPSRLIFLLRDLKVFRPQYIWPNGIRDGQCSHELRPRWSLSLEYLVLEFPLKPLPITPTQALLLCSQPTSFFILLYSGFFEPCSEPSRAPESAESDLLLLWNKGFPPLRVVLLTDLS